MKHIEQSDFKAFTIEPYLPKKGGAMYFVWKLCKSLGLAASLISVAVLAINLIPDFVKAEFKTIALTVSIICLVLGIGLIVLGIIGKKLFIKKTIKQYEDFYKEFEKFNPEKFESQAQSFYYVENNILHIYQNMEELVQISLPQITSFEEFIDLTKEKEFRSDVLKKSIDKKPTLIGCKIVFNETTYYIPVSLVYTKAHIETSFKPDTFLANYNFTTEAFKKLGERINLKNQTPTKVLPKEEVKPEIKKPLDQSKEEITKKPEQEPKKEENTPIKNPIKDEAPKEATKDVKQDK